MLNLLQTLKNAGAAVLSWTTHKAFPAVESFFDHLVLDEVNIVLPIAEKAVADVVKDPTVLLTLAGWHAAAASALPTILGELEAAAIKVAYTNVFAALTAVLNNQTDQAKASA